MSFEIAQDAVKHAQSLGAQQVKALLHRSNHVELQQRDGRLERCSEAAGLSLSISLLVNDRYSSHSSSDLRPRAIQAFIANAVAATRVLEPDPDRAMLPLDQMGSIDPELLDLDDPASFTREPDALRQEVRQLEQAVKDRAPADLVSTTAHLWEYRGQSWTVFSNGFSAKDSATSFGYGADMTIREASGKLPEAHSFLSSTHLAELPPTDAVVADLLERSAMTRDTGPTKSGVYPMILDARAAGRILSALLAPLGGSALHEGRSVFHDSLGVRVGSPAFTLLDDPMIPRAGGSRSHDGDGLKALRRPVFERGVLRTFYLDVYHARKLGRAPTSARTGNLVMRPGLRNWRSIAAELPRAIRVTSFLGGNSNPSSGSFSFGIRGQLLEHGEVVGNLSEMNITGDLAGLISNFVVASDDLWTWSSVRVPSLIFDGVQFSGL